jgi:hypothetical protein
MIRRDGRGRVIETRRYVETKVSGQLLIGDGWEAVAHAELKRLSIEIGIYHQQLKDNAGYQQTAVAIAALEEACDELSDAGELSETESRDRNTT